MACLCSLLVAACGGNAAPVGSTAAPANRPSTTADAASASTSAGDAGAGAARPAPPHAASRLPPDAIALASIDAMARYPSLADAAREANARLRRDFENGASAAQARGDDVSHWRLRLDWRVLMGNRYLRVAEGAGEAVRAGSRIAIAERFTYDGISKRVFAFGDWFDGDAVWPAVSRIAREALLAEAGDDAARRAAIEAATAPKALRLALYEPVFSADGPVMGFDLLFPEGAAVRRVRIPMAAVAAHLAADHRESLEAIAVSD